MCPIPDQQPDLRDLGRLLPLAGERHKREDKRENGPDQPHRQVTRRVFQEGNVVVVNGYNDQTFIDKNGKPSVLMIRTSQTWVKTGGRWLLVDQHTSGMPGTP
jgi:Calcium/calmodulin dependent protein kinase II association domain